jgi:RNA polymerase sigma factor (sigma-70 family)
MTIQDQANQVQADDHLINEAFQFLKADNHEQLIFGVLKRLHVTKASPHYDDLTQEGQIAFVEKYCQAKKAGKQAKALMVYIYQGVYWKLLDYLRKQASINQHVQPVASEDDDPLAVLADPNHTVQGYETNAFASQLREVLTPNEDQYLSLAMLGYNLTEIAAHCGVSRQTVYKWRDRLRQKIINLNQN